MFKKTEPLQNRNEYALLHAFRDLKSIGQDRALEYISALKELPHYAADSSIQV